MFFVLLINEVTVRLWSLREKIFVLGVSCRLVVAVDKVSLRLCEVLYVKFECLCWN